MRRTMFVLSLLAATVLAGVARADGAMSLAKTGWGEGSDTGRFSVLVKFELNNKVWGILGCNRFTGTYRQDEFKLTFGTLATTKMACPEANMKTERRIAAALKATRQADISPQKLVLRDAAGKELLVLNPRAE